MWYLATKFVTMFHKTSNFVEIVLLQFKFHLDMGVKVSNILYTTFHYLINFL